MSSFPARGALRRPSCACLLRTDAQITVFGPDPDPDILSWHRDGALRHDGRHVEGTDLEGAALLYCVSDDPEEDARAAALARRRRVPVNIVDNLEDSDFITPAIVDRDPLTVAIGTEGTAPVLARNLKAVFEAQLPGSLGALARIGQAFRPQAERLPPGRMRHAFWSEYFSRQGLLRLCAKRREGRAQLPEHPSRRDCRGRSPRRLGLPCRRRAGGPGAADTQGPQPSARGGHRGA